MTGKKASPSLGETLVRARRIAPALEKATERLNSALREAEETLRELNLGVTASVDMHVEEMDDAMGWSRQLTFGKHDKEWKLLYESGIEENWSRTPLLNASRELRLEAIDYLPSLVSELTTAAEKAVAEVDSKFRELENFTAAVRVQLPAGQPKPVVKESAEGIAKESGKGGLK